MDLFFFAIARRLLRPFLIFCLIISSNWEVPTQAVEDNGSFNTTDPGSNIPNWSTGWPGSGINGWSYVGQVNGASGVYLGNGWVITAAHVGIGDFTLGGTTYALASGTFLINGGSVDVVLFQIASPPSLPPLPLTQSPPVPYSASGPGDAVAMLGYGGGHGETWGFNKVTGVNYPVLLLGRTSIDFYTTTGAVTIGSQHINNTATVVSGDSGGADFIFKASTGKWQLAGINEAVGDASYFIQISEYVQDILDITGIPAPPVIRVQPSGVSRNPGSSFSLSVAATGANPMTYQWFKSGVAVSGATAATLTVDSASPSDSGNYTAVVTNAYGSDTSLTATVVVAAGIPSMPVWAAGALALLLLVICRNRLAEPLSRQGLLPPPGCSAATPHAILWHDRVQQTEDRILSSSDPGERSPKSKSIPERSI